jgi:hypothetical protein
MENTHDVNLLFSGRRKLAGWDESFLSRVILRDPLSHGLEK